MCGERDAFLLHFLKQDAPACSRFNFSGDDSGTVNIGIANIRNFKASFNAPAGKCSAQRFVFCGVVKIVHMMTDDETDFVRRFVVITEPLHYFSGNNFTFRIMSVHIAVFFQNNGFCNIVQQPGKAGNKQGFGFRSGVESPVYAQVTPQAVTNLHMGDWNDDGVVDGTDLVQLRQAVEQPQVSFMQQAVGDANGDGVLDAADVKLLQQYLLGESVSLAPVSVPACTIVPPAPEPTEPVVTTTTEKSTTTTTTTETTVTTTTEAPRQELTMADFPSDYTYAADWIWNNRITAEKSTERRNTIFDQIDAGNGTINYVVRWQSYRTLTLEQRQQFEKLVSDSINGWNDWLKGWDGWKYDHVDVKIVGWAVLDKSVLQDLQPDEVVYDNLISDYDSTYDTSNGVDTIPDKLPSAPSEISRFAHFADSSYVYPNGLDSRFDMYLWGTQGFPNIGGCGGDWGQRLSDTAYLNMLDGTGIHVLEHEIGHGFGMTDFYGGEGESNGFPPGGFPGGENSLMMAGSAMKITDFDGWMLRYMWSKIKDEDGRFSK